MLFSKANAALARLKEIEEKYKIKNKEQKWKEDMDSSISVSMVPLDSSKESPRKITKLKLDIKMPILQDTRFEGHAEEAKLSSKNEISTPDKVSAKLPEEAAEIDLEDASPLDDKSSRSARKQESLISDPMTIQESSLIESVLDDSVIPSKSLSRSKTSRRNSFTASGRSSGRLERTKITVKSEGGKEFSKSSEISRGKASSDNSISKRLRMSGKSNETSRMRLNQKKHFIDVKTMTETLKKINSKRGQDNLKDSEFLRDDSVVEESIGTMENGSEIISELSHVEESFVIKIEDSIDVSDSSKHVTDENASVTVFNSSKSLAENGYANDTFEDISSSSIRSQREKMINGKKKMQINGVGSGTKKMDIAEYRSYQDSIEEYRDGFDLTPKSTTKIDPRPSDHVSDLERIIENPDNVSVRSLKLPRSVSSRSKNQRSYQHREESFREENVSSGDNAIGLTNLSTVSSNKNSLDSSDSLTGDVTKTDEKKNSSRMTVRQESNRKEREEASNRAREHAVIDVIGLPVANDEDWLESAKSNLSLEKNKERREDISEGNLDQWILKKQDVKYVLKKRSHKDALAKKHTNSKTVTKASKSSFENKSASQIQNILKMRKMREENESCHSSEKHKISNHNSHEHNFKRRKKGTRITNSKSAGNRNSTGSRKEDKALRFDGKQMRGLRKRIVELRLQQEREDLQKYLHKLKNLRLESGFTQSYFKPLEFPKIAEFTQPDVDDLESKPNDQFQERVFAIRRWLKDQYILYHDYCTMAQAINAHYVPTTLDDAKKTIRELRKTTIKTR